MEYAIKNTKLSDSPKSGQADGDVASTDIYLNKAVIKDGGKDAGKNDRIPQL